MRLDFAGLDRLIYDDPLRSELAKPKDTTFKIRKYTVAAAATAVTNPFYSFNLRRFTFARRRVFALSGRVHGR